MARSVILAGTIRCDGCCLPPRWCLCAALRPVGTVALGTGSDPAVVVAPQYGFAVGAAARDVAGNELVAATEVSFTAARQITTTLAPAGSLTGTIGQSGEFEFNFVAVGDTGDGQALRGFVAFEPTTLPDGILEFIEVDLSQITVGHSVHLSDLKLPEGVRLPGLARGDSAVASASIPRGAAEEDKSATAAAPAAADKKEPEKKK